MFDFSKSFRVRNRETGQELDALKITMRLVKVPLTFADRPSFREVERDIVDPKSKKVVSHVKDKAKDFDFAAGDSHGGMISAEPGDYLLFDGSAYFVVPDLDRKSRKPIFSERYDRI